MDISLNIERTRNFLYKQTSVRWNYIAKIKRLGITFKEYWKFKFNVQDSSNNIAESKLLGRTIKRLNSFWFVQNVIELFIDNIYLFKTEKKVPLIIDCGANIGISIIYFKTLYPNAKLIAFEPDPNIYNLCRNNISAFNLNDVIIYNQAVWKENGYIEFVPDNSLGGKISLQNSKKFAQVKTKRLREFLYQEIDFLKIDIEGAEYEVLKDCQDQLHNVKHLFVEYHSDVNTHQNLDQILTILSSGGFRYYIKEAWNIYPHPFVDCSNKMKSMYDLQLNIFAYRDF